MVELSVEPVASIPEELRRSYLASLAEPQELYVEQLVRIGQPYVLAVGDDVQGYVVVTDGMMVEFHLNAASLPVLPAFFALAMDHSGATRALCKTFDTRMVTAAASRPATTRTVGLLFRTAHDPGERSNSPLRPRVGTLADTDAVWSMHDGFFEDRSEIERYASDECLFLYETAADELVGCGILTPVIAGQRAVDVGMVVATAHRRRGVGTAIAADLHLRCRARGDRPICGCSADNEGSRRALEHAGFVTEHSLIEFAY